LLFLHVRDVDPDTLNIFAGIAIRTSFILCITCCSIGLLMCSSWIC